MEILLTQVRAEWGKRNVRSYLPVWVVCGQKRPAKKLARWKENLHHLIPQSLRSFVDLHKHETSSLCLTSQIISTFLPGSPVYSKLPRKWLLKALFRALNAVDDFAKP
jgi:hypothetical protein